MRHTEAYKRRAISDTIKMCISPRCFKRELSRGAPPPRPRNSSPAPISPNRSPCFISLFRCPAGRNNNPPSPNPRLPFAIPFSILRARRIPLRSRSFEKKHRLLLLLLLLLLFFFFLDPIARKFGRQPQVFGRERSQESKGGFLWARIREKKSEKRGSKAGYKRRGRGAFGVRIRLGSATATRRKSRAPPAPVRIVAKRMHFGCSCEFVRASNARVRAPIVYAR